MSVGVPFFTSISCRHPHWSPHAAHPVVDPGPERHLDRVFRGGWQQVPEGVGRVPGEGQGQPAAERGDPRHRQLVDAHVEFAQDRPRAVAGVQSRVRRLGDQGHGRSRAGDRHPLQAEGDPLLLRRQ